MIKGRTITVLRPSATTTSRFGNEIPSAITSKQVANVLIVQGSTADLDASRPEGVRVAFSLHFPKSYTESLEGCSVVLPDEYSGTYKVVGTPKPYMVENTPTSWNRVCEVEAAHG